MVMNNLMPFEIFNDLTNEIKFYLLEIFSDLIKLSLDLLVSKYR